MPAVRDRLPIEKRSRSASAGDSMIPPRPKTGFQIIEDRVVLDCAAARVHARTVEQKYLGQPRWDFLPVSSSRYRNRTILGSGDVFTAEDAVRMLRETGVDIVWIARGAIGNPWIFRHAAELLPTRTSIDFPADDRRTAARARRAFRRLRRKSTVNRWRPGACERWESSTAASIRESADVKTGIHPVQSLRDWRMCWIVGMPRTTSVSGLPRRRR
jgi:tRNA-dihydrouridine synthase